MENFKNLSRYDIGQALTAEQVRITQIIVLAMLLGSILFLIPITVINSTKTVPVVEEGISPLLQQFIWILLFFAALLYGLIYFFPRIYLSPATVSKRLQAAGPGGDARQAAEFLINMDRQFRIIINALFEGVSIFAVVGIFLELTSGEYQVSGDIWLLLLPIVIHALFLFMNFPTKENILNLIEKDILQKIKTPYSV